MTTVGCAASISSIKIIINSFNISVSGYTIKKIKINKKKQKEDNTRKKKKKKKKR